MRLKQGLLVLPQGIDIVTFLEHDGDPPTPGRPSPTHRGKRSPWLSSATATSPPTPTAPSRRTPSTPASSISTTSAGCSATASR
jgi:hypothetical protein